jgi:cation transport ATPase
MWFYYKSNRVHLHTFLVIVAFLKLMVVVIALAYWRVCQLTGNCLSELKYFQSLLFAISETAFFCALLLIAKGWRITRTRLPSSEIRTISVALILLLSTLLFFSFYNDGYYFLSLMIMYFFMLPKIFTSITRNTRALETQLLLITSANVQLETESIHQKIKLFKTLRTSVVIYLGSILLVNSMRIIMIWYLDWFNYVLNEMVVLLMMCLICFILLPNNRYFIYLALITF